jgi:hypothetical protein
MITRARIAASLTHAVRLRLPQNITLEEKAALKQLQEDHSRMILPADKGNATVVLDRIEYEQKVAAHLAAKATYEVTTTVTSQLLLRRVQAEIRRFRHVFGQHYYRVYPSSNRIPQFYALPKIHKTGTPIRPIVSYCGSALYNLAQFVDSHLKPLAKQIDSHIQNSSALVEVITQQQLPLTHQLLSFDVEALYTSIPLLEAIDVVVDRFERHQLTSTTPSQISPAIMRQLLTFMLIKNSYFQYDGQTYIQKIGVPMGQPISATIATLYMEHLEIEYLSTTSTTHAFWYRCMDDILTTAIPEEVSTALANLNALRPGVIKFTIECEKDQKLPFLDVMLTRDDHGHLSTAVYRKPTHTERYLPFESHHHIRHKAAVVKTLLRRSRVIPSSTNARQAEEQHVLEVLAANGYPRRFCHLPDLPVRTSKAAIPVEKTISLPYIRGVTDAIIRILRPNGIRVATYPLRTLRQLLCHPKQPPEVTARSDLVYRINCQACPAFYIGETARALYQRLQEHLGDPKSVVFQHTCLTGHKFDFDNPQILAQHLQKRADRKVAEQHLIWLASIGEENEHLLNLRETIHGPGVWQHLLILQQRSHTTPDLGRHRDLD